MTGMRIGIDWGGTKLEIVALREKHDGSAGAKGGETLLRERIATPKDYTGSIDAIRQMVERVESETGQTGTVGIGIPGTLSPQTGIVRFCPLQWLNDQPLQQDLQAALGREVRIQNDANCFAVSEAVDGAGAGRHTVLGVILGTGFGGGIAIDGKALHGRNAIAAEIGHIPLPWMRENEFPGPKCWCGQYGCLETWISGSAFQRDYQQRSGEKEIRDGAQILMLDNDHARDAFNAYCDRLARALAMLVNVIDPDVIVLGGGMSNAQGLYEQVPVLMAQHVYGGRLDTPLVSARHGDSSGVRGAAWLWS